MFQQHYVVRVDVGRVYWFLAAVVFSCMPFFLRRVVFSKVVFVVAVYVGQMKTRATPKSNTPALLYNGESHIK